MFSLDQRVDIVLHGNKVDRRCENGVVVGNGAGLPLNVAIYIA